MALIEQDHIYLKPLTTKSLIEILKEHKDIDAVLPTMGGPTALNLCIEAVIRLLGLTLVVFKIMPSSFDVFHG